MHHLPFRLHTIAALCAAAFMTQAAAQAPAAGDTPVTGAPAAQVAPVVIVTGSRTEHDIADFPAAIDVVTAEQIRATHMRVNASESLVAVPGLVIQNRQNYAQDLQISSRGFGA
jgi:iron complex outermembrane receptor protein